MCAWARVGAEGSSRFVLAVLSQLMQKANQTSAIDC